jgi:hypothetical protein
MTIYEQGWDFEREQYVSSRKAGRPLGPSAPHYPNKDESACLRQIMARTGLSKEQVLAQKKFRQELAKAQRAGVKTTPQNRRKRHLLDLRRSAVNLAWAKNIPIWEAQAQVGLPQARREYDYHQRRV